MADTVDPATDSDPIDPLRRILESLVPEAGEQVVFRDITGAQHTAPAFASLRTQALLLKLIQQHAPLVQSAMGGSGVAAVVAALNSPEAISALVGAMELLHPRAITAARLHVAAGTQDETGADLDASDLFSLEEMLEAILPFFAAPALRLLGMVRQSGLDAS